MPTYDYVCDACGHKFEEFQYMSEDPLVKCPECKKKKLRRLIGTGAAVIFKGSGFYQTDYRSEGYKSAAKSDAPASPPADSAGGKSDTSSTDGSKNGSSEKPAKKNTNSDK